MRGFSGRGAYRDARAVRRQIHIGRQLRGRQAAGVTRGAQVGTGEVQLPLGMRESTLQLQRRLEVPGGEIVRQDGIDQPGGRIRQLRFQLQRQYATARRQGRIRQTGAQAGHCQAVREIHLRGLQQFYIDPVNHAGECRHLHRALAGIQDALRGNVGRSAQQRRLRGERQLQGMQRTGAGERAADLQGADGQAVGPHLQAGLGSVAADRTRGDGHQVQFAADAAGQMLTEQRIEIRKVGERPLELTPRAVQVLCQGEIPLRMQALPVGLRQRNMHILPRVHLDIRLQRHGLTGEHTAHLHLGLGCMRQVGQFERRGQYPGCGTPHRHRRLRITRHAQRREVATCVRPNSCLA